MPQGRQDKKRNHRSRSKKEIIVCFVIVYRVNWNPSKGVAKRAVCEPRYTHKKFNV